MITSRIRKPKPHALIMLQASVFDTTAIFKLPKLLLGLFHNIIAIPYVLEDPGQFLRISFFYLVHVFEYCRYVVRLAY